MVPHVAMAMVVSQDPDHYAVNVTIQGIFGGQMPTLPVKVLTHGPRDGVRGIFPALPTVGTWGLVLFPRGDIRNGHWAGATDPNLIDASTHAPGLGGTEYSAHFGGGWSWLGMDGTRAEVFPDGTSLLLGSAMPTPTRHTLTDKQARVRTPFTAGQRVSVVPGAFEAVLTHPTGAGAQLNASGTWAFTAAAGESVILQVTGGATATLNPDGSVRISAASGKSVTVESLGGASVVIDGAGSIVASAVGGHTVTVTAGGTTQAVRLADGSASTVLRAQ